jgi:hypothetical protein
LIKRHPLACIGCRRAPCPGDSRASPCAPRAAVAASPRRRAPRGRRHRETPPRHGRWVAPRRLDGLEQPLRVSRLQPREIGGFFRPSGCGRGKCRPDEGLDATIRIDHQPAYPCEFSIKKTVGIAAAAAPSAQRPRCIISAVCAAVPTVLDYLFGLSFFSNCHDLDTHRRRSLAVLATDTFREVDLFGDVAIFNRYFS